MIRYRVVGYRLDAVAGVWAELLPREDHRAIHFEVIDDAGNVVTYAATRGQADAWVRTRTAPVTA